MLAVKSNFLSFFSLLSHTQEEVENIFLTLSREKKERRASKIRKRGDFFLVFLLRRTSQAASFSFWKRLMTFLLIFSFFLWGLFWVKYGAYIQYALPLPSLNILYVCCNSSGVISRDCYRLNLLAFQNISIWTANKRTKKHVLSFIWFTSTNLIVP